ncbi:penicillin-binding protein activator [Catenovulum sediminis]|uniref:Penicillin-binding protein activator n=1 Tax=Catenovulum sediminis TaxID=1740262 RepID=A0ABV1RF60_9ALTE|nr:penicillin-binding protein activator [Catenovulum sediminis]
MKIKLILSLSMVLLFTACESTPPQTQAPTQPVDISPVPDNKISAEQYLSRAANATDEYQATLWYVRAADAYIQENKPAQALTLMSELKTQYMSEFVRHQYNLFQSEALIEFKKYAQAYPFVENIKTLQGFEQRLLQAKSISAEHTHHFLAAARAKIALKDYVAEPAEKETLSNQIWQNLVQLELTALSHFQDPNEVELSGWLALLNVTRTYADSPANMLLNIRHWQAKYPQHPAAQQLPPALQAALKAEPFKPANIAVVLPLSGKFQRQGQAIQQGIIAARFENALSHSPNVTFIDSQTFTIDALQNQAYDFIIGPLLKQHVENLFLADVTIPTLFLNDVPEQSQLSQNQFHYALSPETEAIQAAERMLIEGFENPIVLASNDSFGRRMSEAFIQFYQAQTDRPVAVSFYSNTDEMEESVERLMETAGSRERIATIRSLLGKPKEFEADARNRQDIDAIYVIGDPTQTRILKPYIDINTAPFAPLVPIYASSRSFSSKLNNADLRDLNHIIFSDMPWILPGQANKTKLAHQMQLVWKNQSDDLSRFFAFGYDAYSLVPYLAQMRVFPGFIHQGLTGTLNLTNNGQVERALKWAKFDNGRVINLALTKKAQ